MLKKDRKWNAQLKLRQKKNRRQKQKQKIKATNKKLTNMVNINPNTSRITLNINGLKAPIRRQKL